MFAENVGSTDKMIRLIIGAVIIGVGIYLKSWWGLLGLLPIGTALMGRCGLYLPFGLSTCKMKTETAAKSR